MTWVFLGVLVGAAVGLVVGVASFGFVFWLATALGGYESMRSMLTQGTELGAITGVVSGAAVSLRGIPWQRASFEGASALGILFALYGGTIIPHAASFAQPAIWVWFLCKGVLVAASSGGLTAASAALALPFLPGWPHAAGRTGGR